LLRVSNPLAIRPVDLSLYTGVSPSLISYHFPDPETIISYAAASALLKQARLERSELDDLTQDASTAIERWLELRRTWVKANPNIVAVLASPIVFHLTHLPEWAEADQLVRDGLAVHISVVQNGDQSLSASGNIASGYRSLELNENYSRMKLQACKHCVNYVVTVVSTLC